LLKVSNFHYDEASRFGCERRPHPPISVRTWPAPGERESIPNIPALEFRQRHMALIEEAAAAQARFVDSVVGQAKRLFTKISYAIADGYDFLDLFIGIQESGGRKSSVGVLNRCNSDYLSCHISYQ
jgi:hypothetical protein